MKRMRLIASLMFILYFAITMTTIGYADREDDIPRIYSVEDNEEN